eukprot:6212517-Pleurochrysis_carterae.AAC.16
MESSKMDASNTGIALQLAKAQVLTAMCVSRPGFSGAVMEAARRTLCMACCTHTRPDVATMLTMRQEFEVGMRWKDAMRYSSGDAAAAALETLVPACAERRKVLNSLGAMQPGTVC